MLCIECKLTSLATLNLVVCVPYVESMTAMTRKINLVSTEVKQSKLEAVDYYGSRLPIRRINTHTCVANRLLNKPLMSYVVLLL
jgi:hypothetical protein